MTVSARGGSVPSRDTSQDRRVRLTDRQRVDWLRLIRAENVGPRTFRALINEFGGAARALERVAELARRGGRGNLRIPDREDAEKEIAAAARIGVRFAAVGEEDYPSWLRETEDAPPLIAVRGRASVLLQPMVALVGARNASAAGSRFAAMVAAELGAAGYVIPFDEMLEAYYKARGWDAETGYPTREKLAELNLSWVADDLWDEP